MNPFVLPSDEEVFQMRKNESERRDALRESQAGQKLWERGDVSNLAMTRKMIAQIGACGAAARSSAPQARRRARTPGVRGRSNLPPCLVAPCPPLSFLASSRRSA